MPTLKAPSTYRKIQSTVGPIEKNGLQNVFIEYDASNEYNVPMRSTFWCEYNPNTKTSEQHDDSGLAPDNLGEIQDTTAPTKPELSSPAPVAAPTGGEQPAARTASEEVPVCDQPDSPEKFALMNEIGTDCTGK